MSDPRIQALAEGADERRLIPAVTDDLDELRARTAKEPYVAINHDPFRCHCGQLVTDYHALCVSLRLLMADTTGVAITTHKAGGERG